MMNETHKAERIHDIEKRFPNECLAIIVTRTDRYGDPTEGVLFHHSPSRNEVWERIRGHTEDILVTYTFEWPEGMEVCLIGDIPL